MPRYRACRCAVAFSVCAALCGCAGAKTATAPAPGPAKRAYQAQRPFALGENPSDRQIEDFGFALNGCYKRVILKHSGARLAYSMSPDGASVPFSSALVNCMSEDRAGDCAAFMECVGEKYSAPRR